MDSKLQEMYPAENSDHDQMKTTVTAVDYRLDESIENDWKTNGCFMPENPLNKYTDVGLVFCQGTVQRIPVVDH